MPAFTVAGTELVPLPQPGSGMTPMGSWYQPPPPSRLVFVQPGGGTPYSNDSDICANAAAPHANQTAASHAHVVPAPPRPTSPFLFIAVLLADRLGSRSPTSGNL